jgi:hypothetical protein
MGFAKNGVGLRVSHTDKSPSRGMMPIEAINNGEMCNGIRYPSSTSF